MMHQMTMLKLGIDNGNHSTIFVARFYLIDFNFTE